METQKIEVFWPLSPERTLTKEQLAPISWFNLDDYIIVWGQATKRDTNMKNKEGDGIMVAENFRVFVNVIPKITEDQKTIQELLADYVPPTWDHVAKIITAPQKVWLIEWWDLHYDKIWGKWSIDSQDKRTMDAIYRVTEKLLLNGAQELRMVSGWDLWNSDINYKTTKGTEQQNSMKEKESWKRVTDLYCKILNYLWEQAKTWVRVIPWNHDYVKTHFFNHMLERLYENHPNIDILGGAKPRQYEKFGSHLQWRHHWDWPAEKQIPELMISENPQGWIKTRSFSSFDKHKERTHRSGWVIINQRGAAWELWEWNKRFWVDQVNNTIYGVLIDKKEWPEAEFKVRR